VEGRENKPGLILDELKKSCAFPEKRWLMESFEGIIKQN
jgi:hypothetical protein